MLADYKAWGSANPDCVGKSMITLDCCIDGLTLHILYYGGGGDAFGQHGIRWCGTSRSVVGAWKGRADNMQTVVRMLAKEGSGFRMDVKGFV